MKLKLFILLISIFTLLPAFGKQSTKNPLDVKYTVESYGTDPGASPEEVRARLAALPAEIEMRYTDEVQRYINRYMKNGRREIASLVALSSYYLPIFEDALAGAGLPDELKYLPVIESKLNAKATSNRGAAGLWQFMPVAARGYDMKISSTIDERRDIYISSDRACRMLQDLYKKFGDWGLALAAYNAGPGTVQKALKRAGGDPKKHTFWTVKSYLPSQTQHYVPHFIAINYVMNYYTHHNISEVRVEKPISTDTIHVAQQTSVSKIASELNVDASDIKALNPQLKADVIPASASRPCIIVLPEAPARDYKIAMGRTPKAKAVPAANSTASARSAKKPATKVSSDDFIDVPSQVSPNTYVRVRRSEAAAGERRRRRK